MAAYMIDGYAGSGLIYVRTNYETGITAVLADAQLSLMDAVSHAVVENRNVQRVYTAVLVRDEVTGRERVVEGDKFAIDGDMWRMLKPFNVLDDAPPVLSRRPDGSTVH